MDVQVGATECLHAFPQHRRRPSTPRFPLIHDRLVRRTNSFCECALRQPQSGSQCDQHSIVVVRDRTHCRLWWPVPLRCLAIVATLESLNGFATGERDEFSECHSRAERRLQASILRRLSQRTDVYAIFVGQELHWKKPACRLLQSLRLGHDRTGGVRRPESQVRYVCSATPSRLANSTCDNFIWRRRRLTAFMAAHTMPCRAPPVKRLFAQRDQKGSEWVAKKYFWSPVSDRSEP
jgi:hypothetical protein